MTTDRDVIEDADDLLLRHEIDRVRDEGRMLCRLLGVRADWGEARRVTDRARGLLLVRFRVQVCGGIPSGEVLETITRLLATRGWVGDVTARGALTRLDAARGGSRLCLSASQGRVTLTVWRVVGPLSRGAVVIQGRPPESVVVA